MEVYDEALSDGADAGNKLFRNNNNNNNTNNMLSQASRWFQSRSSLCLEVQATVLHSPGVALGCGAGPRILRKTANHIAEAGHGVDILTHRAPSCFKCDLTTGVQVPHDWKIPLRTFGFDS